MFECTDARALSRLSALTREPRLYCSTSVTSSFCSFPPRTTVTSDRSVHRLSANEGAQGDGVVDLGSGHLDDVVSIFDSGLGCRRSASNRLHLGTAAADPAAVDVPVGERDAEERMLGLAGGDELVGDHHGLVRGDREADADRSGLSALALTQRCRCRVHTDELTITVDQRSTRVAGLIAASVWMAFVIVISFSCEDASSPMFSVDTGRSSAETIRWSRCWPGRADCPEPSPDRPRSASSNHR